MISTRYPKPTDKRPRTWKPHFVIFRVLKIEDERRSCPQWGLVVLDMMERRYSQSKGRWLWRAPK
jgi:hypothetical protein